MSGPHLSVWRCGSHQAGMGIGVVLSALSFVFTFASTQPTARVLAQSSVVRSVGARAELAKRRDFLRVFALRGRLIVVGRLAARRAPEPRARAQARDVAVRGLVLHRARRVDDHRP